MFRLALMGVFADYQSLKSDISGFPRKGYSTRSIEMM